MSDSAIQGYIQALIQADALFAAADVTLGDFLILDNGPAEYAVVLPGRIVSAARRGDWAQVGIIWEHIVEVFYPWELDRSPYTGLVAARQAVVDAIGGNPTLGGHSEIEDAHVAEATAPLYLYRRGTQERPSFVYSRVTVRTVEHVSYAGSGEFTT